LAKKQNSYNSYNIFIGLVEDHCSPNKKQKDLIRNELTIVDEEAQPVIKKVHKANKADANPLAGLFEIVIDGKKFVVEYESDSNLRDTEQVPLIENGGVEAFFKREVLPFASDAWIDTTKTQIGYEISFTKHFHKPLLLRTLEEILIDIQKLENDSKDLLKEIISEAELCR